jgi:hypothetical protein
MKFSDRLKRNVFFKNLAQKKSDFLKITPSALCERYVLRITSACACNRRSTAPSRLKHVA